MKSATHKNKIWPAGSSSTQTLKWRPSTSSSSSSSEEEKVQYYPPPTPHHHTYMMIQRSGSISSREYWDARRAFLSSYSFTAAVDKGGGGDMEWMKRKGKVWVKEAKEKTVGFTGYVVREVKRRRVVVKDFRFTLMLPSFVVIRMRCFAPWIGAKRTSDRFGSIHD